MQTHHLQIVACVLAVASCSMAFAQSAKPAETAKADTSGIVDGGNAFGFDIYHKLAARDGNLFFSPGSIHTALAMTYAGAAGKTAEQMAATLRFPADTFNVPAAFAELIKRLNNPPHVTTHDERGKATTVPAYQLVISNALWGQQGYPFRPEFKQLLDKSYNAALNDVDFAQAEAARRTINGWVEQQTKEKIKDLIPEGVLGTATRMVLTNAVYFKSNWDSQFETSATKDGPFTLAGGKTVEAPLMRQVHRFGYAETRDLQAVDLPYLSNELGMVVLLPKKADGLAAMEKGLSADKLAGLLKAMRHVSVDLTLPKFTFTSQFGLKDLLADLGMTDAFDAEKADFSKMTTQDRLFISAVLHKAFVAVDEDGTEAAAATAVVMGVTAMPMPEDPKVFKADHPFVFLIRHNATGEILFIGRVANPKG